MKLSPLTTFSRDQVDDLRTEIWLAVAIARAGASGPEGLERIVRRSLGLSEEKSSNFRRFDKRESRPFKHAAGPALRALAWPERIEGLWPGTLTWLLTPFWFLISETPSLEQLVQCVLQLPRHYQEDLLVSMPDETPAPLELAFVSPMLICDLSAIVGPQALGALACASQRARMSGDAPCERLAVTAMGWMLFEMCSRAPEIVQPHFARVLDCFLVWSAEYTYAPGLLRPLATKELASFDAVRVQYLALDPIDAGAEIAALFEGRQPADTASRRRVPGAFSAPSD